MKNKVIQKFFTILLGLMMFSPGWAMSGSSSENTAGQGNPFVNAYDYSFTTSGTTVNISFTEHDNYTGLVAYLWNYTNGFVETQMNVSGHTATIALTNQTPGTKLTLACKFAYAGGMSVTKQFEYTVEGGDTPTPPTPPTTGIDWSKIGWIGNGSGNSANTDKYKIETTACMSSVVNIQQAGTATEPGIYITFPKPILSCTLSAAIDGGGMWLYVSQFTAQETEVVVTTEDGDCAFHVYYADGTTGGGEGSDTPTPPTPPEPTENPYCNVEIGHLAESNANPDSYIILSIGSDGAGHTIVNIKQDATKNSQKFDYLQVSGLASTGADVQEGGVEEMEVNFNTPTPDANGDITLEILWSTVGFDGRWMVQNIKVPATATCEGGDTPTPPTPPEPEEITETTFWGQGSNNGVSILYSITRNVNKTLTFHVDAWGDVQGIATPQINIADVYNNVDGSGNWTSTATYETDAVVTLFFYIPFSGNAARIDVAYTVGSENVKPAIEVTGVSIDPASATVEVGKTTSLTAIIKPAFATNTNISWSVTAGTQYASIDANGVVTGLAAGAATVQVTTESGSKTATCDVNVVAQILLEPDAAPAAPTYLAEQVKAVYSATYNADCDFGDWGSGTTYTQDTYGKKYVTTSSGYFGICFEGAKALNCSQMEKLHLDVWARTDLTFRVVPIHGGAEKGVTVNIEGQKWNSIDLSLSEGAYAEVTDWSNVYQIKIDQAANETFWLNNVYFYTTQTKSTYVLSASVKDNEGGTASVSIAEVAKGGTATFTAEAACGYTFVQWLKNDTQVSTDASYTPTDIQEDLTLVAEFAFVGPSEAATVPSYDLVIPIYNEGAKEGVNMFASWGQRTSQEEVTIAGHKVMKYGNINFQGIGFENNKRDVHAMKYVHLDIWSTKTGIIKFSLIWVGGETPVDVSLEGCQWNSVNILLSQWPTADLTQIHQFKFDAQGGAIEGATILVQDIFFYAPNEFTLSETESNETNLTTFNGKVCDVTIARSFTAGSLYTLALPFDMTEAQVAETFGACTMYKLAESYWKVANENMYIRFAPVTEFEANTPILFTPAENIAANEAVAREVTIENGTCETATDLVTFHGTYSKMDLDAPNYILAADQYLYPVVGDEYSINGMRGYFSFGAGVSLAPKMARIILHEEITTDNAFLRNEKQEMRAKKVLENGRFVIIRDGARYGVLGVEE